VTRSACSLLVAVSMLAGRAAAQPVPAPDDASRVAAIAVPTDAPPDTRPGLLVGMYVGSVALHSYDAYSTLTGISANATETNPIVRGMVAHPAVFVAAKGALAVATIAVADQLWRSGHPRRAIALMVVSNGLMALVAAHNAAALHAQRR
jgi:hypothetical protein